MAAITGTSVLVTGANRGVGKALVDEFLRRGAARVFAGTRQPLTHPDDRVVPVPLDVTDSAQIAAAVTAIGGLDILVNNAGLAVLGDDLSDRETLNRHLAVNLFGTYDVTRAFLPALTASRGSIVTILSTSAWANMPLLPGYSVSKAASFSLAQGLRMLLTDQGVRVHTAMLGVVDTDMTRAWTDIPKASPESVARGILNGVEAGEEDIFPDPMAAMLAEGWRNSMAKGLEKEYTALVTATEG